ncbi:hypothetical protein D026_2092 [Vibrio parahaemolyticus 605]|nr:hypothetical protein D035_3841 [Vibrio parahaemolyticus VP250]EQL99559.1 hypothetical protein D036_2091 [Vibrio parahaemolyticus VP232]EQM00768.1 hypothetical protein D040_1160 [Vibrio parahaemolyticus NIHCB0603]EQM42941.1 hypothetical protein D025_2786 [Vibrio parahaemolyticus 949]ETS21884.1 hypothetical protein D033_2595 [Vibrio parahaemolyticus B-265]ETT11220.1 hypothetical protein D026_2092 [Vibrio parahaemolyticus 605]ETX22928.1 hypothetical protein D037_3505 [Vibrio parahaemolyticus 
MVGLGLSYYGVYLNLIITTFNDKSFEFELNFWHFIFN